MSDKLITSSAISACAWITMVSIRVYLPLRSWEDKGSQGTRFLRNQCCTDRVSEGTRDQGTPSLTYIVIEVKNIISAQLLQYYYYLPCCESFIVCTSSTMKNRTNFSEEYLC